MGLVDAAMVGRLGRTELAAVGIATTYLFTLYVFGLGLVGVINTFVSQYDGAGRPERCGLVLGHGLRLATMVGAVTMVVLLLSVLQCFFESYISKEHFDDRMMSIFERKFKCVIVML